MFRCPSAGFTIAKCTLLATSNRFDWSSPDYGPTGSNSGPEVPFEEMCSDLL
jgi:hypothetical protein